MKPAEELQPTLPKKGTWPAIVGLCGYLTRTEVHTYAFSVAANTILALFPFLVLLLTISHSLFHSSHLEVMVDPLLRSFLPTGQQFVMRNMQLLAHPHKGLQIFSLLMLLFSSTGVFMPLEVALNRVWGVTENRSYLRNQLVSLGLAFAVGLLAITSVLLTAAQKPVLLFLFHGDEESLFYRLLGHGSVTIAAGTASIFLFFLVYWMLPNRHVPALAVLPTAIVVGIFWELAKSLYVHVLPALDLQAVYGPFYISVGLMMWAFLSGLLLLAGAHFSATRYALRIARSEEAEERTGETSAV